MTENITVCGLKTAWNIGTLSSYIFPTVIQIN